MQSSFFVFLSSFLGKIKKETEHGFSSSSSLNPDQIVKPHYSLNSTQSISNRYRNKALASLLPSLLLDGRETERWLLQEWWKPGSTETAAQQWLRIDTVVAEIPYVFIQAVYYSVIIYSMLGFEWTVAKFSWFFFVSFFTFLYFTYYGMMTVSVMPNLQVASIFANAFYGIFNLFSGFFIPRPKIPIWWVWYYWICPVAWTVYGLIVSQYGDIEDMIQVPGFGEQRIKDFVSDYFGYNLDFMGVVAGVLVGFTVSFAFLFAFAINTFNFQNR